MTNTLTCVLDTVGTLRSTGHKCTGIKEGIWEEVICSPRPEGDLEKREFKQK